VARLGDAEMAQVFLLQQFDGRQVIEAFFDEQA
jgi:hypothetical protein